MSELALDPHPAPPGSMLYYSFRGIEPNMHSAIMGIHALSQQLIHTAEHFREASVASAKLQWWCEELERLYQNKPQHPISKWLQPAIEQHQLPLSLFHGMIDGAQNFLKTKNTPNNETLINYLQHSDGLREQLIGHILLGNDFDENTLRYTHKLGIGIGLVRQLQHPQSTTNYTIATPYLTTRITLSVIQNKKLRPMRLYSSLQNKLLQKLAHKNFKPGTALTPLGMYWHSLLLA